MDAKAKRYPERAQNANERERERHPQTFQEGADEGELQGEIVFSLYSAQAHSRHIIR